MVETDTTGNHVSPDLTQYDWEYCPIGGRDDFRLINYEKCLELEVYPKNGNPDEGYELVVREFQYVNEGTEDEYIEDGYPIHSTHAGPWHIEMMSALATTITWCDENR